MVWQVIKVFAPGKMILTGEHAVVYGKAAVAISLGLKSQVLLESHPAEQNILMKFENLSLQLKLSIQDVKDIMVELDGVDNLMHPSPSFLDKIKCLLKKNSGDDASSPIKNLTAVIFLFLYLGIHKVHGNSAVIPMRITVSAELSLGAGMGSSASYAVVLAAGFLAATGSITNHLSDKDIKLISDWAFESETIAHGNPSGIDNSICSYGGAILFKDRKISSTLSNMPLLKVLLVDTCVERNTGQLISNAKQKIESYSKVMSSIMDAIDAISMESWRLLSEVSCNGKVIEKMNGLQDLLKMNQYLLKCLDVSHPRLDEICDIAQKHGFAAKLTGAGGGGCGFILLPSDNSEVQSQVGNLKSVLSSRGFKFWDVSLGGSGVSVEIS